MKNIFKSLCFAVVIAIGLQSCEDLDDKLQVPSHLQVENFIWKGLNLYYLWQPDVPDLADTRFTSQEELNTFLSDFSSPQNLFDHLRTDPNIDRFSWIVSDYTVLENSFQGVYKSNGLEYGLKYVEGSNTKVFGWIKYVVPNSDAFAKNILRGHLFYAIDGIELTNINYQELLGKESYTMNFATFVDGELVPNGESVELVKSQMIENPILEKKVLDISGKKIAYLMYNAFTANFDDELNAAFGEFKAQNASELILDLRYNGGGSVLTSARLASMITGQFTNQLFAKQQWNPKIQSYFEEENPERMINNFVNSIGNSTINSLNLSTVYILTSGSTASASELVINGLKPYINVIQVGTTTTGKNVGSITLYDSPSFSRDGRSTSHKYAMQPLTFKIVNKEGFGDYQTGLIPNIELAEDLQNLSQLGNSNEPLLAAAIGAITNNNAAARNTTVKMFKNFKDTRALKPFANEMYLEDFKLPEHFVNFIK